MATIKLMGKTVSTNGELPVEGSTALPFTLTANNLTDKALADFINKNKLISIVPSLDTQVCATSAVKFNEAAKDFSNTAFIIVSADLPFAQQRFCKENNLKNLTTLSMMRNKNFAKDYGVLLQDGPMAGLTARAVVVLNQQNKVIYSELVSDIVNEPDYEKAIAALHRC